jgi:hypothetical protein
MDFTIIEYKKLLLSLQKEGFVFQTFSQFTTNPENKSIVLRHDVDKMPNNSLKFAQIQYDFGIRGTYYFRAVPESCDEKIILKIHEMGHEIGYHYENLTTCKGNIDNAYQNFCYNLEVFRKIVPVTTICMHGSPLSRFDSRDIWKKYDYKSLGLIGEPYLDINFDKILYLSDTGRKWDGYKVSVRDKITSHQKQWQNCGLIFHTTKDIIKSVNNLPDKIMFTFHPQRWHSKKILWLKELVFQYIKNQIKRLKLIAIKNNS